MVWFGLLVIETRIEPKKSVFKKIKLKKLAQFGQLWAVHSFFSSYGKHSGLGQVKMAFKKISNIAFFFLLFELGKRSVDVAQ